MLFVGLGRKKKNPKSNVNKQEIYKKSTGKPIVVKKVSTNEISVKDMFLAKSKALHDKEQEKIRKERERIEELVRPFRDWLLKYNLHTIKQELYKQAKKGNEMFTICKKIDNKEHKVLLEIEQNIANYVTKFNKQDKNIQISYKKDAIKAAIKDDGRYRYHIVGYTFHLTAKFTYSIEDFLKDCFDSYLHPIIPIIIGYYKT